MRQDFGFRADGRLRRTQMDVRKLLEEVKTGEMDLERAEALLKDLPYEDLG